MHEPFWIALLVIDDVGAILCFSPWYLTKTENAIALY